MSKDNKQKEIVEADINESEDKEIQEKLNQSKIQYPIWKGKEVGQTITGYVKEILTFKDLNGKDKHGVLINLQTKNEKFPIVSIWANTVILSNLKRLAELQNFNSFETMTEALKTIQSKVIAIRFEGEVQPTQKGFKPYQNYTLTEI